MRGGKSRRARDFRKTMGVLEVEVDYGHRGGFPG